jgi:hypothetical protein
MTQAAEYHRRKAQGLCPRCQAPVPATLTTICCDVCMAYMNDKARQAKRGRCRNPKCRKETPEANGKTVYCAECQAVKRAKKKAREEAHRVQMRERYVASKQEKICPSCRNPLAPDEHHVVCANCRAYSNRIKSKSREKAVSSWVNCEPLTKEDLRRKLLRDKLFPWP